MLENLPVREGQEVAGTQHYGRAEALQHWCDLRFLVKGCMNKSRVACICDNAIIKYNAIIKCNAIIKYNAFVCCLQQLVTKKKKTF